MTTTTTAGAHRAIRASSAKRLPRLTGVLAIVGGLAWTAAAIVHASQPTGCVGDACASRPMREATTATGLMIALAGVLLVASGSGMVLVVRRVGRLSWPGRIGAALSGLGIACLAVAVAIQELAYDGDFPHMPALVGPGLVALALGAVLLGWTVVRSPVLPTWAGVVLVISALLLVAANEQTAAVLLAVPFGLAWAVIGLVVLRRS